MAAFCPHCWVVEDNCIIIISSSIVVIYCPPHYEPERHALWSEINIGSNNNTMVVLMLRVDAVQVAWCTWFRSAWDRLDRRWPRSASSWPTPTTYCCVCASWRACRRESGMRWVTMISSSAFTQWVVRVRGGVRISDGDKRSCFGGQGGNLNSRLALWSGLGVWNALKVLWIIF